MIKSLTKQTTVNATSVVTVSAATGDTEVPINYMSASIQTNGKFTINQAIQNEEIYFQHIDDANTDYNTFRDLVVELAKSETTTE